MTARPERTAPKRGRMGADLAEHFWAAAVPCLAAWTKAAPHSLNEEKVGRRAGWFWTKQSLQKASGSNLRIQILSEGNASQSTFMPLSEITLELPVTYDGTNA